MTKATLGVHSESRLQVCLCPIIKHGYADAVFSSEAHRTRFHSIFSVAVYLVQGIKEGQEAGEETESKRVFLK